MRRWLRRWETKNATACSVSSASARSKRRPPGTWRGQRWCWRAPTKPTQTQVVLCLAADEQREAQWVTRAIQALLAQGMQKTEIAVLLRTNYLTLPFEAELRQAGIPFVIRGGKGFWELKEVQSILETLWNRSTRAGPSPCPWVGLPYRQPRLAEAVAVQAGAGFPALVRALAEAVATAPPFPAAKDYVRLHR